MRLRISMQSRKPIFIPFNYQYHLQAMVYSLIERSSFNYSTFLHDKGFDSTGKPLKLFTFSKLIFNDYRLTKHGFADISKFTFFFSTQVEKSYEHIVLGIFADQTAKLNFREKNIMEINTVETLPEPEFNENMEFSCLSPLTVSIMDERGKHYLDFMVPEERELFREALKNNLLRKYKELNSKEYSGDTDFEFSFDPGYITKRQGKISKLISFKDNLKIKAMEAPFNIKTNTELIKIAYDCGLGELNSAGFGMIKVI